MELIISASLSSIPVQHDSNGPFELFVTLEDSTKLYIPIIFENGNIEELREKAINTINNICDVAKEREQNE